MTFQRKKSHLKVLAAINALLVRQYTIPRTKIFLKNDVGGPPKFHTRPFRSGMDIKGNPAPKCKKKTAWGPPKNPYWTLIRARNLAGRRKRGGDERAAPPLLNRTRPHALNIGRVLWGSPPKHLVHMLMRTRASSPQPWPVVVGVCRRGAYRNLEDPFNKGTPRSRPSPLCEMVRGYKSTVKNVK
ncbi:hypothetical protein AB205_0079670, partial [Aquarana catesbeiana]